ncbi:hypothetical protein BDN70DRAFT_819435 [Pholiota conissans]|uniref:Uncharacterized protein n=1 Tax=Pholiota conissans TaxID=109636 RepID=A0A9P5YNM7_9AGAR|nr:hypothetical protein BDN70DRAFT_819435 [Pholiota conissans]
MVNPGAFKGSRKQFLQDQAVLYANAVVQDSVADTISDIQRRYFKRYPITLPHDEEPTEEWLAQVDEDAPDHEIVSPKRQAFDNDNDFDIALSAYNEQIKMIKMRKDQIARRLKYQYSKSQDVPSSKFRGKMDDPMFVLMANLTGLAAQKPRRKTGYHDANISGRQKAGIRTQIYKEAYDSLDKEERDEWDNKAVKQYEDALAQYERALDAPPSTTPEDRQRIITGLPKFTQPILDMIADYTGWKATLIAGGPEPADNGRLNMVSMHSGTTSGPVAMNFGRSERVSYKQFVVPIFANFLKKCYTVDECRAAVLPMEHESLATLLKNDKSDWEVHSMDEYVRLSGPSRLSTPPAGALSTPPPSRAPSPVPSQMPSRAPSRALSLAPSRAPGPSPAPSRASFPQHQSATSSSSKRPRDSDDDSLRQRVRARLSEMQTENNDVSFNIEAHTISCPNESTNIGVIGCETTETNDNSTTGVKTTSATSTSSTPTNTASRGVVNWPPIPPLSPIWFTSTLSMLYSENLGEAWVLLLGSYIHFEKVSLYKEDGTLGTKDRPPFIADWIRYARLQPEWRADDGSGILPREDGDLSAIRKPGKNGLLSVIATLFFWGVAACEEEGRSGEPDWLDAVNDVDWIIRGLISSSEDLDTEVEN